MPGYNRVVGGRSKVFSFGDRLRLVFDCPAAGAAVSVSNSERPSSLSCLEAVAWHHGGHRRQRVFSFFVTIT